MTEPKSPPARDPIRAKIMRSVRRADTRAERILKEALERIGVVFVTNDRSLPGTPDIVFPDRRLAVFVHGCYWHRHPGCKRATFPKTHQEYWAKKFEANVKRDERKVQALRQLGWEVRVVWECEVLRDPTGVAASLLGDS